jgi:hypothetical protein
MPRKKVVKTEAPAAVVTEPVITAEAAEAPALLADGDPKMAIEPVIEAEPEPEPEEKTIDPREYERSLDRHYFTEKARVSDAVKAVLAKEHGGDVADLMMRDIDPILADPKRESRRRERRAFRKT